MSTDDGTIKYTVKEMLAEIRGMIADVLIKVDHKADSHEVDELRKEMRDKADRSEVQSLRKKVDSVNTRLVVFSLTVAASALAVAFTVVLTVLRKGS